MSATPTAYAGGKFSLSAEDNSRPFDNKRRNR